MSTDLRDKIEANELDTLALKINGVDKTSELVPFVANFGDNSALIFVIAHGKGTSDLIVQVKKNSTNEEWFGSPVVDATNITITFSGTPPTLNEFRVIAK